MGMKKFGNINELSVFQGLIQVKHWTDMPDYVLTEVEENPARFREIFETPKEKLFASMKEVNPRTAKLLLEEATELMGFHTNWEPGSVQSFKIHFEISNLAITLSPLYFTRDPYLIKKYPDAKEKHEIYYQGLPESLVRAYYTEFGGFENPFGTFCETSQMGMPHGGSYVWAAVDVILDRYRAKKRGLTRLSELMPDVVPQNPKEKWREFAALLDNYNLCEDPRNAFAIMFKTKQSFKDFYVLKADDIDNIRVLKDPIETIDKWCAYMLSGQPADAFEIERYCE